MLLVIIIIIISLIFNIMQNAYIDNIDQAFVRQFLSEKYLSANFFSRNANKKTYSTYRLACSRWTKSVYLFPQWGTQFLIKHWLMYIFHAVYYERRRSLFFSFVCSPFQEQWSINYNISMQEMNFSLYTNDYIFQYNRHENALPFHFCLHFIVFIYQQWRSWSVEIQWSLMSPFTT